MSSIASNRSGLRKLLSAVSACILIVATTCVPVQASWLHPTPADMVRWAGCSATLITSDEHSPIESFYNPSENQIYFGTKPGIPEYVATTILMHETAHCLQHQKPGGVNPADYDWEYSNFELEADYIGAGLQCSVLHRDGARANHDTLVWANHTFGYDGDDNHGTLAQRIGMGYRAPACKPFVNDGA